MDRRTFIGATAATSAAATLGARAGFSGRNPLPKVAIIGGGVFGAWTAWHALQLGTEVTLLDAYEPGHSRASSGGETRQIHSDYENPVYASLSRTSLELWKKWEKEWNTRFLYQTGRILMASEKGMETIKASHRRAKDNGVPSEIVDRKDLRKRWPQINMDGIHLGNYMPTVSLLTARRAVATVAQRFSSKRRETPCRQNGCRCDNEAKVDQRSGPGRQYLRSGCLCVCLRTLVAKDLP